jgi:hypothetical protein
VILLLDIFSNLLVKPISDLLETYSGWWFETFFIFPYIGNVIIPTDELRFFRGVGIPPTSKNLDVLLSSVFSNPALWLIWAYTIQYIWDTIHYENPCENQLVSRDSRGCFFHCSTVVYSRW